MSKLEQAARQALEALEEYRDTQMIQAPRKAITALREALDSSLKPKCFADYQPNHAIDRACAYCAVAAVCQTGEQAEQPVSQEYQDHLVNQSFDWAAMAAKHQFMEGYRIGLAEMREKCAKVVTEHAPTCSPHWVSYVVAIRAIKFEGDTGFRPVSEMVGCAYCNNPLFAGTKCNNCGRITLAEQAEQEPVGWWDAEAHGIAWNCLIDFKDKQPFYAAPVQQAEQKPIGYVIEDNDYEGSKIWAEPINGCCLPVYLAPVRTKDLTDYEILSIPYLGTGEMKTSMVNFARAVIDADREKNK